MTRETRQGLGGFSPVGMSVRLGCENSGLPPSCEVEVEEGVGSGAGGFLSLGLQVLATVGSSQWVRLQI